MRNVYRLKFQLFTIIIIIFTFATSHLHHTLLIVIISGSRNQDLWSLYKSGRSQDFLLNVNLWEKCLSFYKSAACAVHASLRSMNTFWTNFQQRLKALKGPSESRVDLLLSALIFSNTNIKPWRTSPQIERVCITVWCIVSNCALCNRGAHT